VCELITTVINIPKAELGSQTLRCALALRQSRCWTSRTCFAVFARTLSEPVTSTAVRTPVTPLTVDALRHIRMIAEARPCPGDDNFSIHVSFLAQRLSHALTQQYGRITVMLLRLFFTWGTTCAVGSGGTPHRR
jgi:hypothetical protein